MPKVIYEMGWGVVWTGRSSTGRRPTTAVGVGTR